MSALVWFTIGWTAGVAMCLVLHAVIGWASRVPLPDEVGRLAREGGDP